MHTLMVAEGGNARTRFLTGQKAADEPSKEDHLDWALWGYLSDPAPKTPAPESDSE